MQARHYKHQQPQETLLGSSSERGFPFHQQLLVGHEDFLQVNQMQYPHRLEESHQKGKDKQFLKKCKTIIIELSQELTSLQNINDQLQASNERMGQELLQLRTQMKGIQELRASLEGSLRSSHEEYASQLKENGDMKKLCSALTQQKAQLQTVVQEQSIQMSELSAKLSKLESQMEGMRHQYQAEKQAASEQQYREELKKINLRIKKVGSTIQEFSTMRGKEFSHEYSDSEMEQAHTPPPSKQRAYEPTKDKSMRSQSTNTGRKTSFADDRSLHRRGKPTARISEFRVSSEAGSGLEEIKREISRQYVMMERKKEEVKQDQIAHTLDLLERKLGKIVVKIEHSRKEEESSD